ncbi:MAG TPA: hypothetical protein VHN20_19825 [Beijerinckiaceae bacterium]|nr:hypothetical protein [Beijerinckiaceae bacterium]
MRNRPALIASCTSPLLLAGALSICFLVVIFSWPRPREHELALRTVSGPCCDVVVGRAVIDGVDAVPAEARTASISTKR